MARQIHLRGRLLEAEVQKIALPPEPCCRRGFVVHSAAKILDLRISGEIFGITTPTRFPFRRDIVDQRQYQDRIFFDFTLESLGVGMLIILVWSILNGFSNIS